jgi:methylmalonyl-CoA mutase cobalamin-binding subunit
MKDRPVMSIGALARSVGVTEGTLRNWERRYGYPLPERTKGGHRIYGTDVEAKLKLVCTAMRSGHRPAQLLKLEEPQLKALLPRPGDVAPRPDKKEALSPDPSLVDAARAFSSDALLKMFGSRVARVGLLRFVQEDAGGIVEGMGAAWSSGAMDIEHEHFVSEVLRDFLASKWRSLKVSLEGPCVVCGTLPGEQHGLGLQFVACCLAASGYRVLFLGTNLPAASIAATVRDHGAVAVAISISGFSDEATNKSTLRELRRSLPEGTELWTGGRGSDNLQFGDVSFTDLRAFSAFIAGRYPV